MCWRCVMTCYCFDVCDALKIVDVFDVFGVFVVYVIVVRRVVDL